MHPHSEDEFEIQLAKVPSMGEWEPGQLIEFPAKFDLGDSLYVIIYKEDHILRIKKWVSNTVPELP